MNEYEKACREWLKGCSCAQDGDPGECQECTQAFLDKIQGLKAEEKLIQYFKCPSCGEALQERIGATGADLECACGFKTNIEWRPILTFQNPKGSYATFKE